MRSIKTRSIATILFAFFLLAVALPKYSDVKNEKKYNDLLKSYEKDPDYENKTEVLGKNVGDSNSKEAAAVFEKSNAALGSAAQNLVIANGGPLKSIPILIYHCIDASVWGDRPMFVTPDNFERQMRNLKEKEYTAITFHARDREDSIKNPVLITFDDGYENNYTYAYPILKRYGFKATIFLIVNAIDKPRFLQQSQIKEMAGLVDFESHTLTHPHLAGLAPDKLEMELSGSKKTLESLLSKKVDVIAYPYGSFDKNVIQAARKYYAFGVTTNYGKFIATTNNEYTVRRMYVVNGMNLDKFIHLFRR